MNWQKSLALSKVSMIDVKTDITDVKNHVYKAKRALELSKIDQENLRLKVNE